MYNDIANGYTTITNLSWDGGQCKNAVIFKFFNYLLNQTVKYI